MIVIPDRFVVCHTVTRIVTFVRAIESLTLLYGKILSGLSSVDRCGHLQLQHEAEIEKRIGDICN